MRPKGTGAPPAAVVFSVLVLFLGGCAETSGASFEVDAPLKALAWDSTDETLFGLDQGGERLVKVDPKDLNGIEFDDPPPDTVDDSLKLEGAGENLAVDPRTPGEIYLPQPDLDQVHVFGTEDLADVQGFDVGVPPARVALDRFSNTLFALSEDGSKLTRVSLAANEVVAETSIDGGQATLVETPGGGSGTVWVAGPASIALYGGRDLERLGEKPLGARGLAADPNDPERAYASESESGRMVALEPGPRGRLEVVAEAEVGEGMRHLAAEGDRLYAATPDAVVVLGAEDLRMMETIELAPLLEQTPVRRGEPSALAVGEERIYVALAGEPYVLGLDKP